MASKQTLNLANENAPNAELNSAVDNNVLNEQVDNSAEVTATTTELPVKNMLDKLVARRNVQKNQEVSVDEIRSKATAGKPPCSKDARKEAKIHSSNLPRTYTWPLNDSAARTDRLVIHHDESDTDSSEHDATSEEIVEIPRSKRKRPPTPHPRYQKEGESSDTMRKADAQHFLAEAFKSIVPKEMRHRFEKPDFLNDMIAKYCVDSAEVRAKKVTTITTAVDKFAEHISEFPITTPPIVPATLGVYSGLTDPLDFLQRFEGVMSTYSWEEPVACRVFPMVLQGLAREWFHNLQARSISGFIDLRDKFLLQFQNLLPQKKTHIECHDIKQGNRENLNALLTRYIYECQRIPNLNENQKISGFLHAINPQKHPTLVRRLRRDVPPTFAKVQQETYDYLRGGEDSVVTPTCGWGKDKGWRDDNDSFRDGNAENFRGANYARRSGGGGYPRNDRQNQQDNQGYNRRDRYTARKWNNESFNIIAMLTKTPKEILQQERVARSFPDPQPLGENSRRDKSKFCIFHDDHGHDTNRCRDLAELIAEAYEQGKLDHLLAPDAMSSANAILLPADSSTPRAPNANTERKAPAVKNLGVRLVEKNDNLQNLRVIHMVEVGNAAPMLQASARTVGWKCASITFPPMDLVEEFDKPMVISCRIADAGIIVMKVHVDTGSSVDIMYEQCFNKLPDDIRSSLKPTAISLAGFSGESTWPIGQLDLNLELVDEQNEKMKRQAMINLYVMRNQSRFNMILGRTALRMFGAIPSTIHGLLKFSALGGVGTIASARMEPLCAMITLRESVGVEGHAVLA